MQWGYHSLSCIQQSTWSFYMIGLFNIGGGKPSSTDNPELQFARLSWEILKYIKIHTFVYQNTPGYADYFYGENNCSS